MDSGLTVDRHRGIHKWTVGQRCRIPGSSLPYFVFNKDVEKNIIFVVAGTNHPGLYSDFLITRDVHWINEEPIELKNNNVLNCDFRFQHRNPLIPCSVFRTSNNRLFIRLSSPLRALTKGQYAVLYSGSECLGGSMISYTGPSYFALNRQNHIEATGDDNLEVVTSVRNVNVSL